MPEETDKSRTLWGEYFFVLGKKWWLLVASVAFSGAVDAINYALSFINREIPIPRWMGLALGGLAFVVAQFLAFAEMRKQRDEARGELDAVLGGDRTTYQPRLVGEVVQKRLLPRKDGSGYDLTLWVYITNTGTTSVADAYRLRVTDRTGKPVYDTRPLQSAGGFITVSGGITTIRDDPWIYDKTTTSPIQTGAREKGQIKFHIPTEVVARVGSVDELQFALEFRDALNKVCVAKVGEATGARDRYFPGMSSTS